MPKSIDITKIQPTNWRYVVGLILVVMVVLLAIAVGTWIWNTIKGLGAKVAGGIQEVI